MPVCKRCGLCCIFPITDQRKKRCRYLIGKVGGITSCRIYSNRIGTRLGHNYVCIEREKSKGTWPGCPYNKEVNNEKNVL